MNINAIQPDGPGIAIEGQAFGEQPVHLTPEGTQPVQLHQTNADRIRSMTDEELAEWIVRKTDGNGFDGYDERVKAWLDWLKQEAE